MTVDKFPALSTFQIRDVEIIPMTGNFNGIPVPAPILMLVSFDIVADCVSPLGFLSEEGPFEPGVATIGAV